MYTDTDAKNIFRSFTHKSLPSEGSGLVPYCEVIGCRHNHHFRYIYYPLIFNSSNYCFLIQGTQFETLTSDHKKKIYMKSEMTFWQWCCCTVRSSRRWCCVILQMVPKILKALPSLETSGTHQPMTQHRIPENQNQLYQHFTNKLIRQNYQTPKILGLYGGYVLTYIFFLEDSTE